jgi:hypothetical protein
MWFFSHQRLWLMTHIRGKLCGFISYNAQYVVFVLWHILYYNYNLTWSYGTKYICNMCPNLMSNCNFNIIYAIINTIYCDEWKHKVYLTHVSCATTFCPRKITFSCIVNLFIWAHFAWEDGFFIWECQFDPQSGYSLSVQDIRLWRLWCLVWIPFVCLLVILKING